MTTDQAAVVKAPAGHMVGNVEVVGSDDRGDTRVLCNQVIAELRPGGALQVGLNQSRLLAAGCEYRLRHTPEAWKSGRRRCSS